MSDSSDSEQGHPPSHLSIGQVLSLLADEHPELTVSKIRFLESKGLIAPERTPSGYRKFFPSDIETLRWVLVQQRDRYLPLKEIKRLLEGDDGPAASAVPSSAGDERIPPHGPPPSDETSLPSSSAETPSGSAGTAGPPDRRRPTRESGRIAATAPRVQRPDGQGSRERDESGRIAASAAPRLFKARRADDRIPGSGRSEVPGSSRERGEYAALAEQAPPRAGGREPADGRGPASSLADGRGAAADGQKTTADGQASRRLRDPSGGSRPGERGEAAAEGKAPRHPKGPQTEPEGSVSLTAAELAQAMDVDQQAISELKRLGLIIPSGHSGNEPVFSHEALIMVKAVLEFASHGVPARNLRMYRVAADREAGVYQQVVATLIARGNRARLQQDLNEFLDLADTIRRSLLRRLLSPHLD